MSALPKITARPIIRPTFEYRACIHEFTDVNATALSEWYELTKCAYPAGPSFPEFVEMQHEVACEIDHAARALDFERSLDRIDAAVYADGNLM